MLMSLLYSIIIIYYPIKDHRVIVEKKYLRNFIIQELSYIPRKNNCQNAKGGFNYVYEKAKILLF